jgi:hypothetical protein
MQRQPRTGSRGTGRVTSVARWRDRVVWQQMTRERSVALRTDQREFAPRDPRDRWTPGRTIGEPEPQRPFRRSKRWTGRTEPPRWPGTPARPGACSRTHHPLRRKASVPSGTAVARWHPRERGVPGPPGNGDAGRERANKPHGRVWSKHTTGSGGEQTVKVVRNGEGGPKRVWKPATRRGRNATELFGVNGPRREVYPPDWERRRGNEPHGRTQVSRTRRSHATSSRARAEIVEVILEGERKVMSGIQPRTGNGSGGRRTEDAKGRAERREVVGGAGKPSDRLRTAVIR